jgi:periplasmic protein TonB
VNAHVFHAKPCGARAEGLECSPLARFAPKPCVRVRSSRAAGLVAVAIVHGILAGAYVLASPRFYKPAERTVTVVNVMPEKAKPVEPPPRMPIFEPPAVYIPAPIVPEIVVALPPLPDAITITPAPPTPIEAPLAQTPPPEPTRAVGAPAISLADRKAFAAQLFAHLNRHKRYPESARMRRQEGVVSLRFTMDKVGHVLAFAIAKTSGSAALDREAEDLLKRAEPLPAFPPAFGRDTLDLIVPVEFFLR